MIVLSIFDFVFVYLSTCLLVFAKSLLQLKV